MLQTQKERNLAAYHGRHHAWETVVDYCPPCLATMMGPWWRFRQGYARRIQALR